MNENKKRNVLLIVAVVTILLLVVGATYAYFQAQIGDGANSNVNVLTGTTDSLVFTTEGDITITADTDNFGPEAEDKFLEGVTTAKATLRANNTTNTTDKYTYNVYLEVIENNFEYTSYNDGENTKVFTNEYEKTLGNNRDYNGLTKGMNPIPELYLTITEPENFDKEIPGLKKASLLEEDNSYDITELREGIYALAEDYEIQVTGETENPLIHEWEIKVTLKNLETDQELNTGKAFNARIIIQAEKLANDLSDVCSKGDNLAECIKQLHNQSVYGASNIIYHDGKDDIAKGETAGNLEAGDSSYRYAGSYEKVNNYICLGTDCSNKDNLYRIVGTFPNAEGQYETKVVKADYANKELLGEGTTAPTGDVDPVKNGSYYTGYAYQKLQGNNEEQDAYTHRYKGSLPQVDRYKWQENGNDKTPANWETSLLNTIHLNTNYYNKIEETYRNLIKKHEWVYKNKNAKWANIVEAQDVKTTYDNELGTNAQEDKKTDSKYIGLLYVSDYLYGATPNNWNKQPYTGTWGYEMNTNKYDKEGNPVGSLPEKEIDNDYRSATDSNWLYMGLWEWLITINNDSNNPVFAFTVDATGRAGYYFVGAGARVVRPTFYLESSATYKRGTGTASDPYVLDVS